MNQVGTVYLRDRNFVFLNKKFYDRTSFPGNFKSGVVSDSYHIPSPPYLFLYTLKVLVAIQLT